MEVYKEIHVDDLCTFCPDDRAEYDAAKKAWEAYEALTPEEKALIPDPPTEPDESDYFISDRWHPVIVKLTFNRPSRVRIAGLFDSDLIAYENCFSDDKLFATEGRVLRVDAITASGDNACELRLIKGRSPVVYILTGEIYRISVYAEP